MTEDLNVFPNAKSPLFGAGENSVGIITTPATAGLTGSVSSTPGSGVTGDVLGTTSAAFVSFRSQGITTNFSPFNTTNVVVAAGEQVLLHYVAMMGVNNNIQTGAETHQIRRGTTNIGSFSNGNYANAGFAVEGQIIDTPGAGTFSYNVIFTNTQNHAGFQYISLHVNVIQITDTHAGFIQSVAIAGKNIIAADSHTTREISVLPG